MNQAGANHLLSLPKGLYVLRKSYLRVALFICFFLSIFYKSNAQQGVNYAIHANIIYHFTKYIDWPVDKKSGEFVIGIVGDSPLFDELKSFMVNKTVNGQRIVVRKMPASSKAFNCHILFISDEESNNVKKIAGVTAGSPTLLVSESEGMASKGACINFNVVHEHLKLEINKGSIEQRGLSIASELLSLGKIVK